MKKIILVYNSKDFEPMFIKVSDVSLDQELANIFRETLSGEGAKIHLWVKKMWKSELEVDAYVYLDDIEDSDVNPLVDDCQQRYGIGKRYKTKTQKENVLALKEHIHRDTGGST